MTGVRSRNAGSSASLFPSNAPPGGLLVGSSPSQVARGGACTSGGAKSSFYLAITVITTVGQCVRAQGRERRGGLNLHVPQI
ncbi:hypothetical protein GN956_G6961 [Arapaima gigas]